jgi:hypothetical protein
MATHKGGLGIGDMASSKRVQILGVHPVPDNDDIWLIEIEIRGDLDGFDFGDVTQEDYGIPSSNWQVAYDDRLVAQRGETSTYAFFFHFLEFNLPLLTSWGPIEIPSPTPTPRHLANIIYEPPG